MRHTAVLSHSLNRAFYGVEPLENNDLLVVSTALFILQHIFKQKVTMCLAERIINKDHNVQKPHAMMEEQEQADTSACVEMFCIL